MYVYMYAWCLRCVCVVCVVRVYVCVYVCVLGVVCFESVWRVFVVCVDEPVLQHTCVEIRGVRSFLPSSHRFLGLNSAHQISIVYLLSHLTSPGAFSQYLEDSAI